MKRIFLVCAVFMHLGVSYGSDDNDGIGAFAYQDSTGNRYGGTYGLRNGQVVNQEGHFPPNFSPPTFPDLDDFFPEYFNNLDNFLQEACPFIPPLPFIRQPPLRRLYANPFFQRTFESNIENQQLAFDAAKKAFDQTSYQAGYIPNFIPSRYQFGGNIPGFGGFTEPQEVRGPEGFQGGQGFPRFPSFPMPDFRRSDNENSAFASAVLAPGFSRQVANISPPNPNQPNIDQFSNSAGSPGGFKSSYSSSYSRTSNKNGQKTSSQGAETITNDNGKITKYKVES